MTTSNPSGPQTLTKLRSQSSYTASQITEAVLFSSALKHYINLDYSHGPSLHQLRNSAWIEAGLATVLNTHSALEVCASWSQTARQILTTCFSACFSAESTALFAIGKFGSQELNLSSDVDLLIISREENTEHLKSLRKFQKILSEKTSLGFLFRVDFDLRPGGRSGSLIPTVDQFIDYYGNYGETWERLAFVRLTPIAGNIEIISEIESFAKKFSYRRHLDYTLLDDLKNLRSKIRQHYSPRSNESVWDLKLGVGAIRDVELFVHALQVIHGGKNLQLQVHSTGAAIQSLKVCKILPAKDCDFLETHYWQLRALENFVQAKNDEQTHLLEKTDSLPTWAQDLIRSLEDNFETCNRIVASLLGSSAAATSVQLPEDISSSQIWKEILEIEVLSRNKVRDEQSRIQFLNDFHETLQKQKGNIDKALLHLKEFIKSTRAKASFFALLNRNRELLDELAWLFGHSPYLSQILSSRPELMDSYVYRSQDLQKNDLSALLEQLVEKRLLGELINGSRYLEDRDVEILQANLTDIADEICLSLLEELKKEFPTDLQILALGKWGGKELGFRSDLDFILVTAEEPTEVDAKLARRFINRLTELRKGGNIYAIDMRLKPSGKAGPVVISYSQLCDYLKTESELWERQAYLKARWVAADNRNISNLLFNKTLSRANLQNLEKIREDLVRFAPNGWDLKYSEGGLLDIELFAQTYLLTNSIRPQGTSTLEFLSHAESISSLRNNYIQLRQFEQMFQLVATEGGAKLLINHESFQHLAMAFQMSGDELEKKLNVLFSENLQLLKRLDPRRNSKILVPEV